jgi:hypothetical protein
MKKAWKAFEITSAVIILAGVYLSFKYQDSVKYILPVINILGVLLIGGRLKDQLINFLRKEVKKEDK